MTYLQFWSSFYCWNIACKSRIVNTYSNHSNLLMQCHIFTFFFSVLYLVKLILFWASTFSTGRRPTIGDTKCGTLEKGNDSHFLWYSSYVIMITKKANLICGHTFIKGIASTKHLRFQTVRCSGSLIRSMLVTLKHVHCFFPCLFYKLWWN